MGTVIETNHDRRGLAIWLVRIMPILLIGLLTSQSRGQDDYYPLPDRNPGNFGFPYPPPAADEPGVTFSHRYMLDGYPQLEFNPRPQDEIWLVSTRHILSCQGIPGPDQFVCKHPTGTAWKQVPLRQLLDVQQNDTATANVVFIHGNRTDAFWARRRGKMAYQRLVANNPANLPPVRFIIWSWPSDEIPNPLKDFQTKMDRSVFEGQLFGHFLAMLDPGQRISLVTYSMGAQVGFSGIEMASQQHQCCPNIGMIAMAPVTHCRWSPHADRLDLINQQVSQLRFCNNSRDIALRAYRKVCSVSCKTCFTPATDVIARAHPNVRQYDFSRSVGSEHNIIGYVTQPEVRCELDSLLLR